MVASREKFFEILALDREDNRWDYKQDIHSKPKELFYELLKDVLAFSNSGGGHLLLGVEDKNHNLVGVSNIIDESDLGQKIHTSLGYSINIELTYFKHYNEGNEIELGILYIPNAQRIYTSSKTFTGSRNTIIQSDIVYVRRNTSSINANGDDLQEIAYKIIKHGKYEFSELDKSIIKRNKEFADRAARVYEYLEGKYKFSSINFSSKLQELFYNQVKHNKLEFAILLGLDEERIDDYFDGLAVPRIEHILRANEIFKLPTDYFFQPTINLRKPLWYSPMISYCIIDKVVVGKDILFEIDKGEFFRTVFMQMAISVHKFKEWLHSSRTEKPKDDIALLFSDYNDLDDYVSTLSDEKLANYKRHLSRQFYKLLEVAGSGVEREEDLLLPEERIILHLTGFNDEFICRIINESIKEIKVEDKNNISIEFHYYYELKNLIIKGRTYNSEKVMVEFKEEM
ncbi:helix-turn-helix domain-containing protein [Peribacillus frigoritolerans]|uniref:AlbA family DNA-binding domain-containing protein n=1 Tax=Peribacillus frigoritolerans TaxID=450367 RepID=UPI0035CF1063